MLSIYDRLHFYMSMLHSCCDVGVWAFSEDGELFYTSSVHQKELGLLFASSGCMDYALNEGKEIDGAFMMSDALGLVWLGEYALLQSGTRMLVVVGPAFYTAVTQKKLGKLVQSMNLSVQFGNVCKRILSELPVVSMDVFEQYSRMLHCAITGDQITYAKAGYPVYKDQRVQTELSDIPEDTCERRYQLEKLLLKCIEEGNRNYEDIFRQMRLSDTKVFWDENPHLSAVIIMAAFAAHCSDAAIRGGVPIKAAKMLEKEYVLQAQKTETITELTKLNHTMLDAWIDKVNECKMDYGISEPIRGCCVYIREHLTEELELKTLAKEFGYTEYYLTRKFKNEMGIKLSDFIKEKRVEYAKVWLITSNKSVQEIGEMLHFSERSYFSRVFKNIIGVSPEMYREQSRKPVGKGEEADETNETEEGR